MLEIGKKEFVPIRMNLNDLRLRLCQAYKALAQTEAPPIEQ